MPDATPATPASAPTAATPPATPVAAAVATTDTGSATFDWKGLNLPPELQGVVDRHQFEHPSMVLKSYDSLERLHGVPPDRILKLPSAQDAPDAWKPIFQKLGMPETADKYVVPVPEGDPGDFAKIAREWFHAANMTQSQVTKLSEANNAYYQAIKKADADAILARDTAALAELKKSWGADYDANSQLVDKAAEAFGLDQTILDALKQAAGPKKAMEFMHQIGQKLGVEDRSVPGLGNTGFSTAMTPEMAKAEMERLKHDKTYAQLLKSPDPKQRMEVRDRMNKLAEMAYPGTVEMG